MSRQFTYFKKIDTIGSADDTVRFPQSLQFKSHKSKKTLRIIDGYISTQIPNIYNYGGFNNGLVRVSNDNFVTHTDIQLSNGIYNATNVMNAINYSISAWITDINDPPFQLILNNVISTCYIIIDSSKLSVGTQFAIDFSFSSIYTTLGFVTTKKFQTDATFTASHLAQFDTFGNVLSVQISGLGSVSIVSSESTEEITTVDLTSATGNLYRISGDNTIEIDIFPPSQIATYQIKLVGSRSNRQIIFSEGEIKLTFAINEYA